MGWVEFEFVSGFNGQSAGREFMLISDSGATVEIANWKYSSSGGIRYGASNYGGIGEGWGWMLDNTVGQDYTLHGNRAPRLVAGWRTKNRVHFSTQDHGPGAYNGYDNGHYTLRVYYYIDADSTSVRPVSLIGF
jgi:hypothetical protein